MMVPSWKSPLLLLVLFAWSARAEEIVIRLPDAAATQGKTLTLCVEDVKGTYTIPYIQSSRDLHVRLEFTDPAVAAAEVRLLRDGKAVRQHRADRDRLSVCFGDLAPAEYSLECRGLDRDGRQCATARYERIGIGAVIAALGDSLTEGYMGRMFWQDDLNLRAEQFPAESVSRDGRNFPQLAPSAPMNKPNFNCFESWMTVLNNRLTDAWRQPVFIANEGWGGMASEAYLAMMRTDARWKERMRRLAPQVWLVHLGVNDDRAKVPPATVRANLAAIIDELIENYRAKPDCIFLCLPSYDYFPGSEAMLRSYLPEIQGFIQQRGLSRGPDFFAAFANDGQRWYGGDVVHPSPAGMERMAELWTEALLKEMPSGPKAPLGD